MDGDLFLDGWVSCEMQLYMAVGGGRVSRCWAGQGFRRSHADHKEMIKRH